MSAALATLADAQPGQPGHPVQVSTTAPKTRSLGSAKCPSCGRFCPVTAVHDPPFPDDSGYVAIECPTHGQDYA